MMISGILTAESVLIMDKKSSIGLIGLGAMGLPIAGHLQQAGYDLMVYARRPESYDQALKPLITAGARIAETPSAMAAEVDVLITNVHAGPDMLELMVTRPDAILVAPRPGLVVLDHSTIDPATAQVLHQKAAAQSVNYIDAPVSGGVGGAKAGTLVTMMGGDADAISGVATVIKNYTARSRHMGGSGQGSIAKLCNQIAQVIAIEGVAEALSFAASHGADQQKVLEVMSSGFASSRMLELLGPKMIDRDYTPGMESRLLDKDVGIALAAAAQAGLELPGLDQVKTQIARLQDQGWSDQDISIIFELFQK